MKLMWGCSALALGAVSMPSSSALAQETLFGADALLGTVRDERDPADNDAFSGGALPSLQLSGSMVLAQTDGMLFDHGGDTAIGGAVHIGVKLGERHFVGVYGSISGLDRADGLSTKRIGGEVEFNSGPLWLSGVAGYEHAEEQTVFIRRTATDDVYDVYGTRNSFFAFADAGFRPSASTALSVGYRRTGGRDAAAATAAIGITPALALLFQGRAGSGDYKGIFAGLRLRFGGRSEDRRNDLLENRLIEDLFTAGNGRRQLLDPLPPPPPPDDDCGSCGGYCDED
jgi:hypothetical protein